MSARLRDAVRTLLKEIEAEGVHIQAGSPLAPVRDALLEEDRRLIDIDPAVVSDRDIRIARLLSALQHFAKPGGHFVGCQGDKIGTCTPVCREAQLAIERRSLTIEQDTIGRLQAEIAALRREWRHARSRLHNQKLIHRRQLQQIQDETGFVVRTPGRPKKVAPVDEAKAGPEPTTATSRSPDHAQSDLAEDRRRR